MVYKIDKKKNAEKKIIYKKKDKIILHVVHPQAGREPGRGGQEAER